MPHIVPESDKRDEEPVDAVEMPAAAQPHISTAKLLANSRNSNISDLPNLSNLPNTKMSEDDAVSHAGMLDDAHTEENSTKPVDSYAARAPSEAGMVIMHADQVWADFTPIEQNSSNPQPEPAQREENPMHTPAAPPLNATQTQRAQAGKVKQAKQSENAEPSVIKYKWQPEPSA